MKAFFTICMLLFYFTASSQTVLTQMPKPNGTVWAIAKDGNQVYIGGEFTSVNGIPRSHLASFDCTTGVLSNWNPSPDAAVFAIGITSGKLMAAGTFADVAGQTRNGICMFDLTTGNLDSWAAGPYNPYIAQAVGVDNNNFYFSGVSTGGSGYYRLYRVDAVSGAINWQSDDSITGDIHAIVCDGNFVWAGGDRLFRFDKNTGSIDSWNPPLSSSAFITSMAMINSNVYVGGSYNSIDGQSRRGLSAFDASGTLTSFTIQSSSTQIWSMFPDGAFIWVGGNSSSYGGSPRYRMAQFEIATRAVTCWDPSSFSSGWSFVNSILVAGDTVYAGPGFPASPNDYLTVSKASCIGNGIRNIVSTSGNFQVYPNPSSDAFHVEVNASPSNLVSLTVCDMNGRVVERHQNISSPQLFSFGELLHANGLYTLHVLDNEISETIKLIKLN